MQYMSDAVEAFKENIDQIETWPKIWGHTISPSTALEYGDPIAFKEEFLWWVENSATIDYDELEDDYNFLADMTTE